MNLKKPKKIPFDHQREYEWTIIAQSYFQCSLVNARILNKKLSKFATHVGSPLDYCLKEIYGDYPQSPEYLIFPILFNFKHGIEIYLKAILGISNSEFSKGHDLLGLFDETKIEDGGIKSIIEKYSFGRLLLSNDQEYDTENTFERYPQGNPYDTLELFPMINGEGKILKSPDTIETFEEFVDWMKHNNAQSISIIDENKVGQLIKDIEYMYKNLRKLFIRQLK